MQADQQNWVKQLDSDDSSHAPPLHYISTVVTPLRQDLLSSVGLPTSKVEQLERKQDSLDVNEKAVRGNMAWAAERDARRLLAVAKRTRSLNGPAVVRHIACAEGEKLMYHVAAPAEPQQTYHVLPDTLVYWKRNAAPLDDAQMTPHERTTRELLGVTGDAGKSMDIYSTQHVEPIREKLTTSLVKEKQK